MIDAALQDAALWFWIHLIWGGFVIFAVAYIIYLFFRKPVVVNNVVNTSPDSLTLAVQEGAATLRLMYDELKKLTPGELKYLAPGNFAKVDGVAKKRMNLSSPKVKWKTTLKEPTPKKRVIREGDLWQMKLTVAPGEKLPRYFVHRSGWLQVPSCIEITGVNEDSVHFIDNGSPALGEVLMYSPCLKTEVIHEFYDLVARPKKGCATPSDGPESSPEPQQWSEPTKGVREWLLICDRCLKQVKEPGALVFSPPVNDASLKFHICVVCWDDFIQDPRFFLENLQKELRSRLNRTTKPWRLGDLGKKMVSVGGRPFIMGNPKFKLGEWRLGDPKKHPDAAKVMEEVKAELGTVFELEEVEDDDPVRGCGCPEVMEDDHYNTCVLHKPKKTCCDNLVCICNVKPTKGSTLWAKNEFGFPLPITDPRFYRKDVTAMELIRMWNRHFPTGTPVHYYWDTHSNKHRKEVTDTIAVVTQYGDPVVGLKNYPATFISLWDLTWAEDFWRGTGGEKPKEIKRTNPTVTKAFKAFCAADNWNGSYCVGTEIRYYSHGKHTRVYRFAHTTSGAWNDPWSHDAVIRISGEGTAVKLKDVVAVND